MESLQFRNQDNVTTKEGQKTYVPGFNDTSAGAKPDSHLNKHKLLNPDVGHIDITLDQVQVTNHGRLGWNVVFIRHTQFIQRKQILYRQDLCLQKDNPCGTLTQQDKTSQSKQTQCNSRRLAGQTINEQQSLGKIANEAYSTLSVTNLQTPPIGIEDDPIPRKACFPVPNIFSVQRVNGSSPCQPPSPRNLRTSEKISRQNMERKIKYKNMKPVPRELQY